MERKQKRQTNEKINISNSALLSSLSYAILSRWPVEYPTPNPSPTCLLCWLKHALHEIIVHDPASFSPTRKENPVSFDQTSFSSPSARAMQYIANIVTTLDSSAEQVNHDLQQKTTHHLWLWRWVQRAVDHKDTMYSLLDSLPSVSSSCSCTCSRPVSYQQHHPIPHNIHTHASFPLQHHYYLPRPSTTSSSSGSSVLRHIRQHRRIIDDQEHPARYHPPSRTNPTQAARRRMYRVAQDAGTRGAVAAAAASTSIDPSPLSNRVGDRSPAQPTSRDEGRDMRVDDGASVISWISTVSSAEPTPVVSPHRIASVLVHTPKAACVLSLSILVISAAAFQYPLWRYHVLLETRTLLWVMQVTHPPSFRPVYISLRTLLCYIASPTSYPHTMDHDHTNNHDDDDDDDLNNDEEIPHQSSLTHHLSFPVWHRHAIQVYRSLGYTIRRLPRHPGTASAFIGDTITRLLSHRSPIPPSCPVLRYLASWRLPSSPSPSPSSSSISTIVASPRITRSVTIHPSIPAINTSLSPPISSSSSSSLSTLSLPPLPSLSLLNHHSHHPSSLPVLSALLTDARRHSPVSGVGDVPERWHRTQEHIMDGVRYHHYLPLRAGGPTGRVASVGIDWRSVLPAAAAAGDNDNDNNNSNNNNDNLDHAWRSAWEAVLHHTVLHAPLVLPRVLAVLIRVSRRALAAHPVPGAAALYPVLGTPLVTETLAAVVMAMHRRCVLGALMDSPTAGGDVPWDRLRGVLEEGGGEEKTAVDVVMDTIRERLGVNLSDDDNTDNNNKNKGEEDNTDTTDNIGTERSGTTSSTMLRILLSEDSIIDQCGDVIHAAATTPPMTTSRHHHSSLSSTDALRVYLIDLAAALKSTPPYIALRSAAHPPPILHPDAVSRLLSYPVVRRALYAVPDADLAGLYLTLLRGCNTETERRERHEERREQLGKEIETIITW